MSSLSLHWLAVAALLPLVQAQWNFSLSTYPTQCAPLSVSWTGGTAPHTFTFLSLAGIGTNFSSWASGGRYDFIPDQDPSGNIEGSFTLPFAAGSPLVVVGSDASGGWASGGTSAVYTIQPSESGDSSCVQDQTDDSYLQLVPFWPDPATQCEPMVSVFWNAQLPIIINVVIPGGESFVVESPPLNTSTPNGGANTSDGWDPSMMYTLLWTLPVPEQTEIAYLVEDAGGQLFVSGLTEVGPGNSSCLQQQQFTVTAAPYAGAVATGVSTGGSSSSHVGAIVGGVVGGVGGAVLLLGLGAYLVRRSNRQKRREKLKRAVSMLTYPQSRRSRFEGKDKEGWARMADDLPVVEGSSWDRETGVRAPRPAARTEQFVRV